MQCPSVERTFCNLFYVYGRGRRSSSRTAYRLRLRSSPRTLTPSFLLSEKSHAASLLLACKRARDAPTCYQLFSVSSGQVNFFFINQYRCRLFLIHAEIFPLVGNAHRAFRGGKLVRMIFGRPTGKHDIIENNLHIYTINY